MTPGRAEAGCGIYKEGYMGWECGRGKIKAWWESGSFMLKIEEATRDTAIETKELVFVLLDRSDENKSTSTGYVIRKHRMKDGSQQRKCRRR